MSLPPTIEDIARKQGWDDTSLFLLARQFIEDTNLLAAFVIYLEDAADEENSPNE